ncbi:hypothetical protein ACFPMF_20085 [Larkinella bovis]|uniref:Outer membrane protein beta-barrel domain-containing protein n=1 Tax=Larkinella bovis TaxID=683041 RepID=A0ABW0IGQ2_9BACT
MRKIITLVFVLFSAVAYSQTPTSKRLSSGIDIGAGFKKDYLVPSFTYYELLNLDANQTFSIGWTVRVGAFYAKNLDYITAPARLTREKTGFAALSAPLVEDNLDTMRFSRVSATSANLGVRAQIRLGPVELGASADVIGFGFGKNRRGIYHSSTGMFMGADTAGKEVKLSFSDHPTQYAQPKRINTRLLGDNDQGALATEVYVRLLVMRRLGVRVSYQWITTEMHASNENIVTENQRFRNRASMVYVGLSFPFFK